MSGLLILDEVTGSIAEYGVGNALQIYHGLLLAAISLRRVLLLRIRAEVTPRLNYPLKPGGMSATFCAHGFEWLCKAWQSQ
eukprot:5439727-Amphidinium_carterae.2